MQLFLDFHTHTATHTRRHVCVCICVCTMRKILFIFVEVYVEKDTLTHSSNTFNINKMSLPTHENVAPPSSRMISSRLFVCVYIYKHTYIHTNMCETNIRKKNLRSWIFICKVWHDFFLSYTLLHVVSSSNSIFLNIWKNYIFTTLIAALKVSKMYGFDVMIHRSVFIELWFQ